jgi:uncharacterized DUF497 family protein
MFDWDPRKAKANQLKHGVSFEEAATLFWDMQAYQKAQRRGARKLTSGDVQQQYVEQGNCSATKHMGFFSSLAKGT